MQSYKNMRHNNGGTMKLFIMTSSILWVIAVIGLFISVYLVGVEHGRLQGLQRGTDTECEVLEDMLSRR